MNCKIGKHTIGDNQPVFIIAELSCNHLQKFKLAVKTIEAMKEAGVDAVKIQTYTPDTMTLDVQNKYFTIKQDTIWDGMNFHKLYKEAYTPWDWQPKLQKIAKRLGLEFFSSPFDVSATDFLEKLNVPAYKIASFEIRDIPLIRHTAKKSKPMIISTGIADYEDIKLAVKTCHQVGNKQVTLLKCTSAYPTPMNEVNLLTMPDIRKKFKTLVGLSDHTLGDTVPIAATALGACIIEKHFILDRKLGGHDAAFSMEPVEFKQMVDHIRATEQALGKATYKLTPKALKGRLLGRSLFAAENIDRGEKFTQSNVRSVRPGYGLHPKYYDKIVGRKKAKQSIRAGTPLKLSMIS